MKSIFEQINGAYTLQGDYLADTEEQAQAFFFRLVKEVVNKDLIYT